MRILAGDVGGTKTILQLTDVNADERVVLREERYVGEGVASFDDLIRRFVVPGDGPIESACFGVAGPVKDDRAELTNLNWVIDARLLESKFGIGRVRLVNDFFAVARGIPRLGPDDTVAIQAGDRDRSRPIAILGAGTGLGEAIMVPSGSRWIVVPGEGGHADFAPGTEEQIDLLRYLSGRFDHVSYERILSGPGIVNVFTFLKERAGESAQLDGEPADWPARIAAMADEGDTTATRALEMFIEVYGTEAGNLALKAMSFGGVYIAGGIATRNVGRFLDGRFVDFFTRKGRMSDQLARMPIDLILNARVGLMGAAAIAEEH